MASSFTIDWKVNTMLTRSGSSALTGSAMKCKKNGTVTIVDVAARCGLSISTISRALHAPELVRTETRELIENAIRETGYIYNANAGNFAKKKNNLIGFISPTATDSSFSTIVTELQMAALQKGYDVFVANSFYSPKAESRLLQRFMERRVSAVGMLGFCFGQEKKILQVRESGIPVLVLVSPVNETGVSNITISGQEASRLATAYLLELGHTRIGFILGKYQTFQPAKDRLSGYAQAYADASLTHSEHWIVSTDTPDIECGRFAMNYLMSLDPRPTAVITADDTLALGAQLAAKRLGLDVPGDISLMGMEDADFSGWLFPPLTTVHIPSKRMAQLAANFFNGVMDADDPPLIHECLPVSLVIRESCAPVVC